MNSFEGTAWGPLVQAGHIDRVVQHTDAPPPVALAGLPPVEAAFTGRAAELADLADFLRPDAGPPAPVCVLAGPPGIGKTTLALRAAHDAVAAGWFPGGVLFQDLRGFARARRVEPEAALEVHLRALGVVGQHLPPDLAGREALHRSLLAERPGRVLLVLDNAELAAQVVPLLPGDGRHRVLVTSRNALGDLAPARRRELGVLSGDESVALVARLLDAAHDGDERVGEAGEVAGELAALCGYLPQALAIAGGLLASDPDQPVAELVDALTDRGERLAELETGERSVRAALDLSYERLPAPAAHLFRLLAANPGPTVSVDAAAALAGLPERAARRCLTVLRRAHLVGPAGPRGWFRLHELVRLYAEERLRGRPDPDAFRRLPAHHNRMLLALTVRTFPDKLITVEPGPSPGKLLSHAELLAWFDAERPNLVAVFDAAAREGHHAQVVHSATMLAVQLQLRGSWDEALTAHLLAVDAAREVDDLAATGYAATYLGKAYSAMRDFGRAEHHLRRGIEAYRRLGDREGIDWVSTELEGNRIQARRSDPSRWADPGTPPPERRTVPSGQAGVGTVLNALDALSNDGTALFDRGRFDEALTRFERVLAGCRETGYRTGEASTLSNIGNCHFSMGSHDQAIAYYTASAAAAREVGNRHGEALTRSVLGVAYETVGRIEDAVTEYERAGETFRALGDRHGEGITLYYLGRTAAEQGDHDRARRHLHRCLQLLDQRLDDGAEAWARELLATLEG
ncbi:tetratricopeptide repeat protein [Saccharothrix sp. BKS2]|uniref:ATP-binding protein n=1 Tax=Saccharothrix sp. BKS2 TaxID=3064400 RepID=UPI0039E9AD4F